MIGEQRLHRRLQQRFIAEHAVNGLLALDSLVTLQSEGVILDGFEQAMDYQVKAFPMTPLEGM